jgi:hypothetical protein
MPSIDEAQHRLHRADEARAIAAKMTNPEPKLVMSDIAECYVRLAKYAEQRREAAGDPHPEDPLSSGKLRRHTGV